MQEHVPAEIVNQIYQRARRCECADQACTHAGQCNNDLKDWGVVLPEGTPEREQLVKGRAFCLECFMRTPSYIRQEAWRRPISSS